MRSLICSCLLILCFALPPAWAAQAGEPAPPFSLPSLSGETVALASFRGKVVAVVFWTTWTKHISSQLHDLTALEEELGPQGLVVLAVDRGEDEKTVGDFLAAHKLTPRVLLDAGDAARAYGVNGLPDIWIVDRAGVLKAHFVGYSPADLPRIRALVEKELAPPKEEQPPEEAARPSPEIPASLRAYARLQMGAAHINIGDAFVKAGYADEGHYQMARDEFTAGIALDPRNADLHVWLGLALERLGDGEDAGREYQTALKLDPHNAYAQDSLRRLGVPWSPPGERPDTPPAPPVPVN